MLGFGGLHRLANNLMHMCVIQAYRTSDHLPVYATFDISAEMEHHDEDSYQQQRRPKVGQTQSQVCLVS